MSQEDLTKEEILKHIIAIVENHIEISEILTQKFCRECTSEDPEWAEKRESIFTKLKGLMLPYSFTSRLPQNEDGVIALSVFSHLFQVQYTFAKIAIMLDMVRGASFQDVYIDSLSSIAAKINEQFKALSRFLTYCIEGSEKAGEEREAIKRLEREIDEDNIIICRQVSVMTGGDSPFTCYMMRKIVSELEHISDYLKDLAEIVADF